MEEWRAVVGFEGYYEISSQGRLRNAKTRNGSHKGRILRACPTKKGYPHTNLCVDGGMTTRTIHRLVCEAFLGLRPDGLQVNHKNGDKADNRVENLEYVTAKENAQHARTVLGRGRGEDMGTPKLTEADVRKIRAMAAEGATHRSIAAMFGVCKTTVGYAIIGRSWSHVLQDKETRSA